MEDNNLADPEDGPLDEHELAMAGDDLDDMDEDGSESAQDAAGDGDGAEGDGDDGQDEPGQAWEVIMAERDAAGQWRTIGEPVKGARFPTMDLAHDFAEVRNRVSFKGFDWLDDPGAAWLAVPVGMRGALRGNGVAIGDNCTTLTAAS